MKKPKNEVNIDAEFACTYFRTSDNEGNELVAVTGPDCKTHTFKLLLIEEVNGEPILVLTPETPVDGYVENEIVLYRVIDDGHAIVFTGRSVLSKEEFAMFNVRKPK